MSTDILQTQELNTNTLNQMEHSLHPENIMNRELDPMHDIMNLPKQTGREFITNTYSRNRMVNLLLNICNDIQVRNEIKQSTFR